MRYFLLLGLLLGLATAGRAQAPTTPRPLPGTIRGLLADSATGQPLREASVSLTLAKDSSYVGFGITDGDGRFALRNVAAGRYVVQVSALGFRPRLLPVAVTDANPAPDLGVLRLGPLSQKLGEVVVTQSAAPVEVHGDTLDFNARAFKTQPNAAVEALLKKLPGVEVARDGSIRAQGQAVSRVLVDGKPFFGDDPKLATRNLPAELIDRVQMYDQQNDQAAFSGIDDGNRQRTINLVTKRDKRKGWFGTNGAGPGTDGRYYAQLGLNRFNNGRQLSALAQADTAGGTVHSAGLGNVALAVVAPDTTIRRAVTAHGTAGRSSTRVHEVETPFPVGATLVLHTDGLASRWHLDGRTGLLRHSALVVAAVLWRDFARETDDSCVVVVRSEVAR